MSRLMGVALTEAAVVAKTKTVTRRIGWKFLKPGDRLTLCRKVMGRKQGEPLVRLAEVEVVSVRREPLSAFPVDDIAREGLPWGFDSVREWTWWFMQQTGAAYDSEVTRIEWRYLDTKDES